MNSVIYDINDSFDFDKLTLNPPMVVAGGNYFIKYQMNGSNLYIQPPQCKLRGKISKTSKKPYCDLMFSQENTNFIKWMEDLEDKTCEKIYEKREDWFDSDMELADIENYFAAPLKSFKSGKFYLARTFLASQFGKITLKIYNENKEEINIDSIDENVNVVSILEIQGIKCSSRSFQIEMEIKQMMTMKPVNLFENCLINSNNKEILNNANVPSDVSNENDSNNLEETENEEVPQEIEAEVTEDITNEEVPQEIEAEINEDIIDEEDIKEMPPEEPIESKDLEENITNDENIEIDTSETNDENELTELDDLEFNVNLEELDKDDSIQIKPHNDIYYERYREAQKRARIAKNLALQAYLEAKEIKNKYHLEDVDSDDEDFFSNTIDNNENNEQAIS